MRHFTEHIIFWGVFSQVVLKASFEDHQDDTKKKADRFGMGWWDSDPWHSEPQPPAPIGPPQRPGPVRPPAPLDQNGARPPAPLVQPPAPIQNNHHQGNHEQSDHVTRSGVHADDINCVRSNGVTLLSAVVVPPADYTSQPVFEDAAGPNYSPADCAMRPNEGQGYPPRTFAMHVHHFSKCGVRVQQGSDGKEWISVTLRFPFMEGLRMAEDEYVMIMCKPQDRVATTQHVMDLRGSAIEGRSVQTKKVFRNGPKDVACRMHLMTRAQGSRSFNKEMKSGATVRVGQDLQIRGIVKEGDGWNFAMLKDVIISRIASNRFSANSRTSHYPHNSHDSGGNTIDIGENAVYRDQRTTGHGDDSAAHEIAQLVFSDGCRNPMYRPVAPFHPLRDTKNPLIVSFTFKAFMFQDMLDGESLRLSAQVVACADLVDCQQAFCNGDVPRGKKKRRNVNGTGFEDQHNIKNFTEDFQLSVTLGGFTKTPLGSSAGEEVAVRPSSGMGGDCKLILISVSSASLLICLVTTSAAAIAIGSRRRGLTPEQKDELKCRKYLERCRRRS